MNLKKVTLLTITLVLSVINTTTFTHSGCCGCKSTTNTTKKKAVVTQAPVVAPVLTEIQVTAEKDTANKEKTKKADDAKN